MFSVPAVFLDQPGYAVTPLAVAFGALDAEHVELPRDVAEGEIGAGAWLTVSGARREARTLVPNPLHPKFAKSP
jgi:hypothetical protein